MTILCVAKEDRTIYLGSDTMGIDDGNRYIGTGFKFLKCGHFYIGIAGMHRFSTSISRGLKPTATNIEKLALDMENLFRAENLPTQAPNAGWPFESLVVNSKTGEMALVDSMLGVCHSNGSPIFAGSGSNFCAGAYYSLDSIASDLFSPRMKMEMALNLTCEHLTSCGGPVIVREIKISKKS